MLIICLYENVIINNIKHNFKNIAVHTIVQTSKRFVISYDGPFCRHYYNNPPLLRRVYNLLETYKHTSIYNQWYKVHYFWFFFLFQGLKSIINRYYILVYYTYASVVALYGFGYVDIIKL